MKINVLDASFTVIATVGLLNLNGAILMAVGVPQMGSPFLLLASLILVFQLGSSRLSITIRLLFLSFLSYLTLAIVFGLAFNPSMSFGRLPLAYSITVLMLWAMVAYIEHAYRTDKITYMLHVVRNLSVIATATVLASPILYSVFRSVPPSADNRFGGFFGNPNEAGIMACVALAFVLAEPYKRKWLQIICLIAIPLAAILTFSKTAWLVLPIIWLLHLLRSSRRNPILLMVMILVLSILSLVSVTDVLDWILSNPFFEVSLAQERRIKQVMFLVVASGEAENTLTGRDFLWKYGFQQIKQSPLLGHGLGSFHHMVGGLLEEGVWQGVHNVYLMIWGEAGLIPFTLFIIVTLRLAWSVTTAPRHPVSLTLAMILFLNLQVNHNALSTRFFLVLLAVLLGLQSHSQLVTRSRYGIQT